MPITIPEQSALPTITPGRSPIASDNGSSALRQGLEAALGAEHDIAIDLQRRRNAAALFDFESALHESVAAAETDWMSRRGRNALDLEVEVAAFWDSAQARLDAAENAAQRELMERSYGRIRAASIESARRHEATQTAQAAVEAAGAAIEAERSAGIRTPTYASQAAAQIRLRVDALAELQGWAPETRDRALAEQLSALHAGVVETLAGSDPGQARAYLDAHRGEIDGAIGSRLAEVVDQQGTAAIAQRAVDAYVAEGLSAKDARARARKEFSGSQRDAVVARVNARYDEIQREAADEAWTIWDQTGDASQVPADVWVRLDQSTRDALIRKQPGDNRPTDAERFQQLLTQVAENPESFRATVDLRKEPLSNEDRATLAKLSTMTEDRTAYDPATLTQQLAQRVAGLNEKKAAQLTSRAYQLLFHEAQIKGRELAFDERERVLDWLVMEAAVPGWFNDRPVYQLSDEQFRQAAVERLSEVNEARQLELLRARHPNASEEELLDIHERALAIMRQAGE